MERFLVPTQFFAVALAGKGLAFLLKRIRPREARFPHVWWTVACLLLLSLHIGKNVHQNLVRARQFKSVGRESAQAAQPRLEPILEMLAGKAADEEHVA